MYLYGIRDQKFMSSTVAVRFLLCVSVFSVFRVLFVRKLIALSSKLIASNPSLVLKRRLSISTA